MKAIIQIEKLKDDALQKLMQPETMQSLEHRIATAVKQKRKVRSDAVKALKIKVYIQPQPNQATLDHIARNVKNWCADYFQSEKNVISFYTNDKLVAAILCPITNDGRLCAKQFYGSAMLKSKIERSLLEHLKLVGIETLKLIVPKNSKPETPTKTTKKATVFGQNPDMALLKTNFADLSKAYRLIKKEKFKLKREVERLQDELERIKTASIN